MSRDPRYEFSDGSMDRHPIEMNNGWVRIVDTVAVISIQRLLCRVFSPSADLAGVELAKTVKARTAGDNEHHTTADDRCTGTDVNAGGNVKVGRRRVDGKLVQTVSGPVMINTADDEIKIVKFRMLAVRSKRRHRGE